jgi:hypothetical protein
VGIEENRTARDDVAARQSARDQWIQSTLDHFLDACQHWRTAPEHSVNKIRLVLEGWAHATSIEREPGFAPYDGRKLHRALLAERMKFASRHLPRNLQEYVKHAKALADHVHHNQGDHEPTEPYTAQGMLIQCVALVEWTYREIGHTDAPPALREALRKLRGATLEEAVPATLTTPLPGSSAAPRSETAPFSGRIPPPPPRTGARSRPSAGRDVAVIVAVVAIGLVLVLAAALAFRRDSSPDEVTLRYARAYGEALESGDVDQIVRLQAFPTRRFFMGTNYSEAQVRKLYGGWFAGQGSTRKTGFKSCNAMPPSPNGELAAVCDTYVAPALTPDPGLVRACLVFTPDGRLVSRTEIRSFPACPPPLP